MTNLKGKIESSDLSVELQDQQSKLLETINDRISTLKEKQKDIDTEIANYPLKKNKVCEAADEMFLAGKNIIDRLKDQFATNNQILNRLQVCEQNLTQMKNNLTTKYANQDVLNLEDAKFLKSFGKDFAKQLASATGMKEKNLKKEFKKAHIDVLEKKEWKTVSNDFTVTCDKKQVKVNSTITPAAKLPFLKPEMQADNLNGITCHDQGRATHAANLWNTEVSANGKTLYSGIRHSINCAFDITDPEARKAANANRAKDVYKAILSKNPNLLEEALKGKTVKLDIVSVALMTPDLPRSVLFKFKSQERVHLAEQTQAWKDACDNNGICKMQITDENGQEHTISIQPNVVTFNYGVNQGAQNTGLQTILKSWDVSDEMNKQALTTLIGNPNSEGIHGMVGQFLENCQDAGLRNKITTLVNQIKDLHQSEGYRIPGEDSFRMPARINLLAHLCGFNPCFNCKSGKDRTGQLDVSTKELALSLEMKNNVTTNTAKDPERKKLMADFALHSGNLEVQEYNTGMAGFRLKGLNCLEKIYGNSMNHFVGLSQLC